MKLFLREVSFGWPATVQIRLTSSGSSDQSNHPILMKQLLIDSQETEEPTRMQMNPTNQ